MEELVEIQIQEPTVPADKFIPVDEFQGVLTGTTYTVYLPITTHKKQADKRNHEAIVENLKDFRI